MEDYIEVLEGPAFPGLRAPCTISVSRVSGSGKTSLVYKILKHRNVIFTIPVHRIMYCRSVDQHLYEDMRKEIPDITFHRGVPTEEVLDKWTDGSRHCLVVLDDLMEQVVRDVDAQSLFTKFSHHKCISVIFISQNMYAQGKCARSINTNTHYHFVMCNPRDVSQINIMAHQTGLGQTLKDSNKDCVLRKRYGYQLISLHPGDVYEEQ